MGKGRESLFLPGIESAIDSQFVARPYPFFLEMESYAKDKNIPILSPASGKILQMLVRWKSPKKILELGTGLGYSTLWMHLGNPDTKIVSLDRRESQAELLFSFARELPLAKSQIQLVAGEILPWIEEHSGTLGDFDFVFVDCDKIHYPYLWEEFWKQSKPGTVLSWDNTLWHGRVFGPEATRPSDSAVKRFWSFVQKDCPEATLVPAGDGLLVAEKT